MAFRCALVATALAAALCPVTGLSQTIEDHNAMASRVLACTACHGKEGRSTPDGYFPRIAGKPAGYLYNQLINFRDGRRNYAPMAHLLRHLTDAYLWEMATHFSALDLPYPSAPAPKVPKALFQHGEQLALRGDPARKLPACVQCHGADLAGGRYIPGLLGLPRDYINGQIGAWKTGGRQAHAPDCMARVAEKLTPADIGAVSAWLAVQPVPLSVPRAHVNPLTPLPCGGIGPGAGEGGS